jgi:hypothetical protein
MFSLCDGAGQKGRFSISEQPCARAHASSAKGSSIYLIKCVEKDGRGGNAGGWAGRWHEK